MFTSYVTPEDSVPRWELLDWDCDLVVGGVSISPGDVIVGDMDGVVVVPRKMAVEVLRAAESRFVGNLATAVFGPDGSVNSE